MKEVSSERNCMDLPQDVALWPCVFTDAFVTECIDREPDYFQNRNPEKYPLSRRYYPGRTRYLSDSLKLNVSIGGVSL
jgi:hypothetical protein